MDLVKEDKVLMLLIHEIKLEEKEVLGLGEKVWINSEGVRIIINPPFPHISIFVYLPSL